jgi:lipoprotein-anchoring transpeptidase ErfK/SrfK
VLRRVLALGLPAFLAISLVACGGSDTSRPSVSDDTAATTDDTLSLADVPEGSSLVASAVVPSVPIYDSPDGSETQAIEPITYPQCTSEGQSGCVQEGGPVQVPLVFLVKDQEDDWLEVYLPVEPNGSTGWLRERDVTLSENPFRIEVDVTGHEIVVYEANEEFLRGAIGVGTQDTPTPGGIYYVRELIQPPDPNTVYGPYAYGLSGFSEALESFNGGEPVIGIHGNNDASVLGSDVSSGCIRMDNDQIIELVETPLPLGTPVEILA